MNFKRFLNESNTGYHYGDLGYGRDTGLGRMAGRSTGHFGTGVYFLGKPSSGNARDDRPVKEIDLSKYNLARPRTERNAKLLHDALKKINSAVFHEGEEQTRLIKKAAFELWLSLLPKQDEEQIQEFILKAVADAGKEFPDVSFESHYVDSASTRVMKALGYDGVDVRGIPNFDNTDYGSVIYAKQL